MSAIKNMSRSELLSSISARKNEIAEKLQKGETQESFEIGGSSFTNSEWDKLIGKVDSQIDEIKAAKEKLMESAQKLFAKLYEAQQGAAGAGPDMGAGAGPDMNNGSASNGNPYGDDVVDGDYKEV